MNRVRQELLERLGRLDEDAALIYEDQERFRLTVVGGSALVLLGASARPTYDINVLALPPELAALAEKYDVNARAGAFAGSFPADWQARARLLLTGQRIEVRAAAPEDLIVSKLYAGRTVDGVDLCERQLAALVEWPLLESAAQHFAQTLPTVERERFLRAYTRYRRRWRQCGS